LKTKRLRKYCNSYESYRVSNYAITQLCSYAYPFNLKRKHEGTLKVNFG